MAIVAGAGATSLSSLAVYLSAQKSTDARAERIERDPTVQRRIDEFQDRAESITSLDELIADRRLFSFVLDAFDLGSEIDKTAFVKAAIEGGPEGLAFFLRDVRYREIAAFFDVPTRGVTQLTTTSGQNELIDRFKTLAGERAIGFESERARQALFFKRIAPTIGDPVELLGNNLTRDIALTALNLPPQIALQSVDKQVALVEAGVDIEKFDDPEYLDKFLTRFLVNADLQDNRSTASAGAAVYAAQQIAGQIATANPGSGLLNLVT